MLPIKNDNVYHMARHLARHNISVSELKQTPESMSQPSQQGHLKKVIHLPKIRMLGRGRPSSGIRITNVKSIKPPDPELVRKQEEDSLRAQLTKEIEARSRSCANKDFECPLPVLTGRSYCARHILQDPTAPYKQCAHSSGGGQRCTEPAPTGQPNDRRDQGLCFEHARAALAARQRAAAPPPPVTTTETLLNQLQHYVKPERVRTTSCASSVSVVSDPAEQDVIAPHAVDPFKQIDATAVTAAVSSNLMECASGTDSDAESVTLGRDGDCRAGPEDGESGDEDTPLDERPLRHAGIFTAEEAVSEAKNYLKLLQAGYIGQMERLRVLLQQARYTYLKALKAEKEQYCSINSQARSGPLTVKERRQLRKLKAYASFHRKHGADAVLARKLARKRARVNEPASSRPPPSHARCTFAEGGVRCVAAVLPASKHCGKHILQDRQQVLFSPCGDPRGAAACREPVPRLPVPALACRYHTDPPAYTVFTSKKDDTDTDSETYSASDYSQNEDFEHFPMEHGEAVYNTNSLAKV